MIPAPLMGFNARALLTREEWNTLRLHVYQRAGYQCEVCGGRGDHHPVEAHEVWVYDDEHAVQRMERIVALCPECHGAVHYGLAIKQGRGTRAARQLQQVNGWSIQETEDHIIEAWTTWHHRNNRDAWQVDVQHVLDLYREVTGTLPTFMEETP